MSIYKIIAFKTDSGGGVGFLRDDITLEEMEKFLIFEDQYGDCPWMNRDTYEDCGVCVHCTMQNPVIRYNHIGAIEDLDVSQLINFQDKFYYQGGDCC